MFRAVDALLFQLQRAGIRTIIGNPGTFEQALLDRLPAHPGVRYVMTLHEAAAMGIALGYARTARQVAFVQLHASVGLTNGLSFLLEAKQSRCPIVVYDGENSTADEPYGGFLAADLVALAAPVCKSVERVLVPEQLTRQLRRAIQTATTLPYGPVLLAVPMDVLEAEMLEPDIAAVTPVSLAGGWPGESLRSAVELLTNAERPIILAGDAVGWCEAQSELSQVAAKLGAPIHAVGWSLTSAALDDPNYRGHLPHTLGASNRALFDSADAILSVGAPLQWEIFPERTFRLPDGSKLIQLDTDAVPLGRNVPADIAIHGDVKSLLSQLVEALGSSNRVLVPRVNDPIPNATPSNHPFAMLSALAPFIAGADAIVEEGMTATPVLRKALPIDRVAHYLPVLSRSLGAGWPSAIGASLAQPGRRIWAFCADGASLYTPQCLWTVAKERLPIAFVVLNNASYRVLKLNLDHYRQRLGLDSTGYPHMDLTYPAIDFVALGLSFGLPSFRAESPDEIQSILSGVFSWPFLIDLRIAEA